MSVSTLFPIQLQKDLPFFAKAMSSIIAIGLLGKLFQILSLQPFHEIYYDDTSVWTERKELLKVYLKLFAFHLVVCFSPQFVLNALVQI